MQLIKAHIPLPQVMGTLLSSNNVFTYVRAPHVVSHAIVPVPNLRTVLRYRYVRIVSRGLVVLRDPQRKIFTGGTVEHIIDLHRLSSSSSVLFISIHCSDPVRSVCRVALQSSALTHHHEAHKSPSIHHPPLLHSHPVFGLYTHRQTRLRPQPHHPNLNPTPRHRYLI